MLLNVSNLYYSFHTISGRYQVLSDISFSVSAGDFISIIGPKGCGKSTLLSVISGILPPDSGTIERKINNIVKYKNLIVYSNPSLSRLSSAKSEPSISSSSSSSSPSNSSSSSVSRSMSSTSSSAVM